MARMNRQSARPGTVNNVVVATTSTAAASAAFGSQTFQIRIAATAQANFKIDQAPTATASDALLIPNRVQYATVSPGQKISVFADHSNHLSSGNQPMTEKRLQVRRSDTFFARSEVHFCTDAMSIQYIDARTNRATESRSICLRPRDSDIAI